MNSRDIYMRHTGKDGNSYVQSHRVWDAERFILSQEESAKREGGRAKAEQITEEQYLKEKKA